MKTSYQLLQKYLSLTIPPEDISKLLTQQGLEVEETLLYGDLPAELLIVEVVSKEAHPDSDHLWICQIFTGKETFQVVCGAQNFKISDKVIFAPIGTTMPNGLLIQQATLRGVNSFGMLCSSKELGLFDSDGLWVLPNETQVGLLLQDYLGNTKDTIYDISLTPNRGDCLGTLGIAREIALLQKQSIKEIINPISFNFTVSESIPKPEIKIETTSCTRYTSRIIKDVLVKESPTWLKIALKKYGLHPINNLVDISNFIMMELGHPVHIFDLDILEFPITIRDSNKNENIILLSGEEFLIPQNTILITDKKGPIALGGIMGGKNSGVQNNTRNILLEVAYFNPDAVRGTLNTSHLHTDASYRFARNTDISTTTFILDCLTQLILDVSSGIVGPVQDIYPVLCIEKEILISESFIEKKLGFVITTDQIKTILNQLNFTFLYAEGKFTVTVPTYRNDCNIPEDLVEEILRIYGYENIPIKIPANVPSLEEDIIQKPLFFTIKELLASNGLQEIYTFSLGKKEYHKYYSDTNKKIIDLKNPLGIDLGFLRTSLSYNVLPYLKGLAQKGTKTFHGFEIGNIFFEEQNYAEETHLCIFQMGNNIPTNFKRTSVLVDFYTTKAHLELLFQELGIGKDILFVASENSVSFLHPHKSANIFYKDVYLGYIGEVHPKFWSDYKGKNNIIISEINLNLFIQNTLSPIQESSSFKTISKFPKIERDLAFVLQSSIPAQDIITYISSISGLITQVRVVDSYESEKLGEDKRSLSFQIIFQDYEKTLTDQEIQPLIDQIINWVKTEKQGILREF